MARSIDAILKEVSSKSDPQRQTILSQVADIPRQIKAETAGINAQRKQANEDILGSARDRGVGFGGIPIGEQAKYAATEFDPALARLSTAGVNRRTTLESALADIGRTDFSQAQDIFRDERNFAEDRRRFELAQQEAARGRAAAAAASEQNILAKYGIDLNNLSGGSAESTQTTNALASGEIDRAGLNYINQLGNGRGLRVLSRGGVAPAGFTQPTGGLTFR